MATARSLAAAAKAATRGEHVLRLALAESTDLQCRNIMCEKLEQACVCKLARFVAQTRLAELQELDITSNRIDTLPTAVFEHLPSLETLVVARNKIRAIPPEISGLASLRVLDIRENPIETMPFETIAKLPKLERVLVHGLSPEIIVRLCNQKYNLIWQSLQSSVSWRTQSDSPRVRLEYTMAALESSLAGTPCKVVSDALEVNNTEHAEASPASSLPRQA